MCFFRTNTQGTGTDDERPDAEMFFLKQRTADYTVGYCEVKINESNSNSLDIHYGMLRLTKFGKNICDEENLVVGNFVKKKYSVLFLYPTSF